MEGEIGDKVNEIKRLEQERKQQCESYQNLEKQMK